MKEYSADDVLIKLKIKYAGDAELLVHSALVINFPSPGFAKLPFKLHVSNFTLEGPQQQQHCPHCLMNELLWYCGGLTLVFQAWC